jgi:hypothetical protein
LQDRAAGNFPAKIIKLAQSYNSFWNDIAAPRSFASV